MDSIDLVVADADVVRSGKIQGQEGNKSGNKNRQNRPSPDLSPPSVIRRREHFATLHNYLQCQALVILSHLATV